LLATRRSGTGLRVSVMESGLEERMVAATAGEQAEEGRAPLGR
jgi:hypothetical protein